MSRSSASYLFGPVVSLVSALTYFLAYRVNAWFDHATLYAQGIHILYLPAGVNFISILIGGVWGALGTFVALMFVVMQVWSNASAWELISYCIVSTGTAWATIYGCVKVFRIEVDLSNLRFMHLPMIAIVSSATHGVSANIYLFAVDLKGEAFWGNSLAMILGDFLGIFALLTALWIVLIAIRQSKSGKP